MLIRRFEKQDFATYQEWFADQELNARIGPIDQEWLEHVLTETNGTQLVVFEEQSLIGCCGLIYPTQEEDYYFITDISVDPKAKRKGFAKRIILQIQERLDPTGQKVWKAVVEESNIAAIGLLRSLHWQREIERDSDNMLAYKSKV